MISSMPTMHSMHSLPQHVRHSTMHSPQSKSSMPSGKRHPVRNVMRHFTLLLLWQWESSMNTTSGQQHQMHTSLQWVSQRLLLMFSCLILDSVALNPADKFAYFRKHWGEDLYHEVLETIQQWVCCIISVILVALTNETSSSSDTT